MTDGSLFETKLTQLRKWRKRKRVLAFMAWFLSFALILNAVSLGLQKWLQGTEFALPINLILILIAFVAVLLWQLLRRRNFLSELIEIDTRLNLKDRLSTAYEYSLSGKPSRFRGRLLFDAGRAVEDLSSRQVYPFRFSAPHLLIPLFIFIILGLWLFEFPSPQPRHLIPPEKQIQLASEMEKFSKAKQLEARSKNDPSLGEPYRQLEELAKDLQNNALRQEKLLLTLGEMKKEATAERLALSKKLEKELQGDPSPGQTGPSSLSQELNTPGDLKNKTDQLKELFGGTLPESISRDMARIGEKMELEQFLDKALSLALPSEPGGEDRSPQSKSDRTFLEKSDLLAPMVKTPSGGTNATGSPGKDQVKGDGPPKSGPGSEESPQEAGKKSLEKNRDPFIAGKGKGTGEKLLPYEMKGEKGPSYKEQGGPSTIPPQSAFQVRALPLFGKSPNSPEEIQPGGPTSFREKSEAVLLKEKVPREYRETVKQYFISIKQEKGKKQNDRSY